MYERFVALGDSFAEGLDDLREDGSYRGWADLVAAELATKTASFRYANLAIRGRRLTQIWDEQLATAEDMAPDLVGFSAGGNDIIGFRCDVGRLARDMHEMLVRLVRTGATVVVFTAFDPRGRLPLSRLLATRAAAYNDSIEDSAAELGVHVVDLWNMRGLYDPVMWAPDRLHLSVHGHALVAAAVLHTLGERPSSDRADGQQGAARAAWLSARRADAEWLGNYFAPWVGRKLRGRSAGDFLTPKLPDLTNVSTNVRAG